jgi:hypothetical protein
VTSSNCHFTGTQEQFFDITTIRGGLAFIAIREIAREPEVIELFKKLVGTGPLPPH